LAQSAVAYDAVYGPIGGLQTALTDVLGNKQYYFFLSNTAQSRSSILTSFNVGATYVNKTRRINYGAGLYHLYDEYLDDFLGIFDERQAGGAVFASYPFSKFRRVEATGFLRYSRRNYQFAGRRREAALFTGSLAWVEDNSLWELSGPIDGHRYNFSVSLTADAGQAKFFNRSVSGDLRKYFRLGRASAYALRLAGFSSSGEEPQRIYLGGSWSLRGYSRRAFYGQHMLLASNELRFPLINRLMVGLPFGNVGLEAIRGALFFDAGNAWNGDFGRLKGALGVGARVNFGYLAVLRFDWARRTDFKKLEPTTRFDFFFGWNF
jgi:outer membrane protein assembly factor BamA